MKNNLKRIILAMLLAVLSVNARSQILHPVKWSYAAKKISKTEAIVYIKATIDEGWHVYSQTVKEGGPVKTTFSFDSSAAYVVSGGTIEPEPINKFEKVFNMTVGYFESSAIFRQRVKLRKATATIKGNLNFMTCNDRQCLPPEDVSFSIPVK